MAPFSKTFDKTRESFICYPKDSQRIKKERLTLYLTPLIKILFFSSFILVLIPLTVDGYYENLSFFYRDTFKIPLLELVDESKIVTEELRALPSGLKIDCKISPN